MPEYSERFQMFWKMYPRRVGRLLGKVKCYGYWKKLNDEDQLLCCRAAGAYAQYYTRALRPGEFRPEPRDPERFLRMDWWRDWLEPEAKPCAFRSLSEPCTKMAESGHTHCKEHQVFIANMDAMRARHGMSQPKRTTL